MVASTFASSIISWWISMWYLDWRNRKSEREFKIFVKLLKSITRRRHQKWKVAKSEHWTRPFNVLHLREHDSVNQRATINAFYISVSSGSVPYRDIWSFGILSRCRSGSSKWSTWTGKPLVWRIRVAMQLCKPSGFLGAPFLALSGLVIVRTAIANI
jgi:hypothetical protein